MNQRLPDWLRLIVGASALIQLCFGIALMTKPALIGDLWPWTMPPLTTRILGASTLVSVPLALLSVGLNRFSFAAIPFVMMATYRVLQLAFSHRAQRSPGSSRRHRLRCLCREFSSLQQNRTRGPRNSEDHSGVGCGITLSSSLRHSPSSNNAA